jgi:hypothetical protein
MIVRGKWAASNIIYTQGIELNTATRSYRRTFSIFRGFHFYGSWQALPKIDYVLLFKTL